MFVAISIFVAISTPNQERLLSPVPVPPLLRGSEVEASVWGLGGSVGLGVLAGQ